jgi:transcriptional regulator with XRE-family HTH domain
MTIGEKLTALRIRKGYSQEEFCKAFNRRYPELTIKRSRYSKWEIDSNPIEVPMLKALVTFHGITADELIFEHVKVGVLTASKTKNRRLEVAKKHT